MSDFRFKVVAMIRRQLPFTICFSPAIRPLLVSVLVHALLAGLSTGQALPVQGEAATTDDESSLREEIENEHAQKFTVSPAKVRPRANLEAPAATAQYSQLFTRGPSIAIRSDHSHGPAIGAPLRC